MGLCPLRCAFPRGILVKKKPIFIFPKILWGELASGQEGQSDDLRQRFPRKLVAVKPDAKEILKAASLFKMVQRSVAQAPQLPKINSQ